MFEGLTADRIMDFIVGLFINGLQIAFLGLVLVVLLFHLGLFARALKWSGSVNFGRIQRGVLASMLVLYIVFPHNLTNVAFHSITLIFALVLFLFFRPNHLDIRVLVPYLVFIVPLVTGTLLLIAADTEFRNPAKLRGIFFGIVASYLVASYFRNTADLKIMARLVLPVLVFSAVLSIAQSVTGVNFLVSQVYGGYFGKSGTNFRLAYGFGYNHLKHAMGQLVGLAIVLYLYFQYRSKRLISLFVIILLITSIILSTSEAVWVGLASMVLVISGLLTGRMRVTALVGIPVCIAIVGLILLLFTSRGIISPYAGLSGISPLILKTMVRITSPLEMLALLGSRSLERRIEIWAGGLTVFTKSPLIGSGVSNFDVNFDGDSSFLVDAHSMYLSLLVETGLLGFFGFLLMNVLILRRAWQHRASMGRDGRLAFRLMLGLMVGFWSTAFFWHLEVHRIYWVAIGVLNGLSNYRGSPVTCIPNKLPV